ncbi:hypothetical protein IB236_17425 [Acidovorax sp. ACV02]|uniref:hypothetical protein n=1 Tax=Acidovorax sp. ACV02 TaxID=2769310 RepID=UPI00177FB3B5|nr:hypothetical protein [Acidovorax sp. ACV02]MBD9407129.1 hypothetical protein [Acidovorax sp. ACV02]
MTINPSNIRLLESERMTDTTDGGGRRTNRVIPDGVAGNIFPKVSRIDSVYGRVNLRKVFPHINTSSLDVYAGAHFVITDAPDNNRISVLAFSTASDFDNRTAARDRIESYVIAGPESRMVLYGRQLRGSQAILIYQRAEEPLPEIGEVYSISTEVGGVTTAQQFVRVQDVAHELRTLTDDGGEFQRRIITLKIGARLRYEFQGLATPSRFSQQAASSPGKMRVTTVADAARYYGIQPLSVAASADDLELTLASIYAPIVPTTQREAVLSLVSIAGASTVIPAAASPLPERYMPDAVPANSGTATVHLPGGIAPGTLSLRLVYFGNGSNTVTVQADGTVPPIEAGVFFRVAGGQVDHASGLITLTGVYGSSGAAAHLFATYTPGGAVSQPAHTKSIPITLGTRGTVYAVPLLPVPAPGTLMVDYRALGKWYRLRDNGAGELVGSDAAYGTGTVDPVTGGVAITLGALPDVGSSLLLSWGSPVHFELINTAAVGKATQAFLLPELPVKPGSISLHFTAGSTAFTVTDSGGALSGGGVTGTVDYTTGLCKLSYGTKAPNPDSAITVDYVQLGPADPGAPTVQSMNVPLASGSIATGRSWVAGSVVVYASITDPFGALQTIQLRDDGTGVLRAASVAGRVEWSLGTTNNIANINYSTGVIDVIGPVKAYVQVNASTPSASWYETVESSHPLTPSQTVQVSGTTGATATDVPQSVTLSMAADAPLQIDLTSSTRRLVVAGSVMFDFAGKTYIDRSGTLYTDVSYTTGSGLPSGSIDYETGIATLAEWVSGATLALTMRAGLVVRGRWTAEAVSFRTAGSPLRPASLFVQCTAADGELLASTSDQNGVITGGGVTGQVEQTMGVVNVQFPKPVMPGTLRYSTVVLSNLPLDADILGLDPVRLPSDGRVPIYRPADVALLHHTASFDAGTPTAGSTINVGRTELAALWMEDANRLKLSESLYVSDLEAGTATMAADLSLTGYVTPITAKHRIEETVLLSDVQINGVVSLTAPLLRDFPLGSFLSGALLYGDLQARATNLFDQQSWTGVWQDSVIGSGATAQYNDIDHPVEVLNNGAITERWRIHFLTTSTFQVIGENLGVIATGTTSADVQPVNPLTTLPYFTLRFAGFGGGWAAGNQLRFNTIAAAPPTWLARVVLPGAALTGDSFDAQLRGDVD